MHTPTPPPLDVDERICLVVGNGPGNWTRARSGSEDMAAVSSLGTTLPVGSVVPSFGLEVVLTFFLMFVIISVATDTRAVGQATALAIGGTVGLEAMFARPISGASMNPARSLAPALVSGNWTAQWLYVAGPIAGVGGDLQDAAGEPEL